MSVDLPSYLARIGIPVPAAPDLIALRAIVTAHGRTIPFENLASFSGRDVPLDDDALVAKLVHGGRGGYCYEQNHLLRGALDALGYRTTGLLARVVWGAAPDAPAAPRSHMLLRVDLPEGPHVVDVGFGGQTLTGVLALEPETEQATPHEPFRLMPDGDGFVMQARVEDTWRSLYVFDLAEAFRADYEVVNFHVSHHPDSPFVTGIRAARPAEGRRHALNGTPGNGATFAVHHLDGPSERHDLADPRAVRDALEDHLLIDTARVPDLDTTLARLF